MSKLLLLPLILAFTSTLAGQSPLNELETKIQAATAKVLPAVVAVRGPRAAEKAGPTQPRDFSTGVIVSEDGLILSQYHVSHLTSERNWGGVTPKGTKTIVVYADGSEAEAELLGADLFHDLSMLKLTKPGKYPFVTLDGPLPQLGVPVLKLGHPDGYYVGREPLVRLGRVVSSADAVFTTDCPIVGGDSGGPYFDLEGRLIGIIRSSTVPLSVHAASGAARGRGVIPFSVTPTATILARFDDLRVGKVIGDLISDSEEAKRFHQAIQTSKALPANRWSQGEETRAAWKNIVAEAHYSVVSILEGEVQVSLGTIVEPELVLTKASSLPEKLTCRFTNGKEATAEVVGVDPAFDLALLRVKMEGAKPIRWSKANPRVGSVLVAPGIEEIPLAAGVLSSARRDFTMVPPKSMARRASVRAAPPALLGSAVAGRGYWIEFVGGAAASAGLRPGDVVITIGTTPIRDHADLAAAVEGRFAGERLPVALLREGKTILATLQLTGVGRNLLNPRAEGFPTFFEFDMPLIASECGGPILALDGSAVGITLARANATGCQAVPHDVIQKLLPELKVGKPLATLPSRPATPGKLPPVMVPNKPVSVDLPEIQKRLAERGNDFRSAFIEYETTSALTIDPRLAASWGLRFLRESSETHQFAFDGPKRLFVTLKPGVSAYAVPPTQVVPAPGAPPEVVRGIEMSSRYASSNELATGIPPWFLGIAKDPAKSRSLFDGKDAYLQLPGFPQMGKTAAGLFVSDPVYLIGLGLRPADPNPAEPIKKAQAAMWFPGNFANYTEAKVRPQKESIDGYDCVVVEAVTTGMNGKQTEMLWLDPAIGYAPRRWETRAEGVLVIRRSNSKFEEFAPKCWLPWEATVETGPPNWVAKEFQEQPIHRVTIRLKRAVVNQSKEEWFKP